MLAFLFGGNYLFRFFGISLPAFQIAGGIVIFYNGFAMVRAQVQAKYTAEEASEGIRKDDFAIVPLAIPMICGPATISTVILYAAEANGSTEIAVLAAAVLAAAIVHYVLLALSTEVSRVLGITGMNVLTRIMGLLLASIAVQIVIKGLGASYNLITGHAA
jgi:multiple antibiotic resistance protein